jgi:hypothetical protein
MDRLLRDIQAELVPGREPAPVLLDGDPARDAPAPLQTPTPGPQVQVLTEVSSSLLAAMRELLAGYERILVGCAPPRPIRRAARRPTESPDVTLSAAPFANLDALHAFEQAVSRLPGVRDVAVRGYEGTDRAIIEVRLDPP